MKKENQENVVKGMIAGLAAFFMFALMQMFAKVLSDNHHVVEIAFFRNAIAFVPLMIAAFAFRKKELYQINSNKIGIGIRGVLGTISLIVTFSAFIAMPLADTTAFLFTSSLFIPMLGFFFLGERVGINRWSAILIGFVGVLIMVSPTGDVNVKGVTLALSAAVLHAILQTILRHLGKTERPETVTFYFIGIGTVLTGIFLPWFFTVPTWQDVPLFLGCGLSGLFAQYLISLAYKNASAAIVTVFNYSGIIWATLLGWMIWHDWPATTIWIGGTIVIASNIFIIWRESRLGKITGDRVRAKL